MSKAVLKVENISKLYRLGEVGTGTISHDLNRWWNRMRGKEDPYLKVGEENDRSRRGNSDYVWSLKDISFEVNQGEVLGIVGKNGAGKSTLLKILSQITTPTTGEVRVKGSIASLLEVGTGFHPELTGRENIFLNGAILGMTKGEIKSKLDQIVDFSGVEKYIDTPVKRYSSGMMVRLGFAVAAHLEPEILIVDEVLAVGDAEFQSKCLGKMKDVSQEGRTVLFVSHNIDAVNTLCEKGLYLKKGQIQCFGQIEVALSRYLGDDKNVEDISTFRLPTGNNLARIESLQLNSGKPEITYGRDIIASITVDTLENINGVQIVCGIYNYLEHNVALCYIKDQLNLRKGTNNIGVTINTSSNLMPGEYKFAASLIKGDFISGYENLDIIMGYPSFKIIAQKESNLNVSKWKSSWGSIMFTGTLDR